MTTKVTVSTELVISTDAKTTGIDGRIISLAAGRAAERRSRRPAIAMTVDGREHVVHYPSCKPWDGPI